ncbi:MAG: hypothetical protein P4L56_25230 [Candidatus Sulfopaludibacter sp.]|nr:hypothetical protein [Candidatus Sulfopaludibacter sp.]
MLLQKAPRNVPTTDGYKRELEYLYARKTAINMLIRSLQEYDLSRIQWSEHEKRKSA